MTRAGSAGYRAPLARIRYALKYAARVSDVLALDRYAHVDQELVDTLLTEAGAFAEDALAPLYRTGDIEGARLDVGVVSTPAGYLSAYRQFVEAGWGTLPHPIEFGGGDLPLTVAFAVREMITAANLPFSMAPFLGGGIIATLLAHGSSEQQGRYLPKLVSGEWTGSMDITEPAAGTDVGAAATRAALRPDGRYAITGTKIFISFGDHDLTEQVVHLVLARIVGAPAGSRGLSLFIVPKFGCEPDGSLGERNDVQVVGLEHKLGLRAAPTCVVDFGSASDGAVAELVGEPNDGLRQMFTMMNDARLGVGVQGLALSERAYQQAAEFARTRVQGRTSGALAASTGTIADHPDVRRMLLTMLSQIHAMRCLLYRTALALDLAAAHPDPVVQQQNQALADLLTPIAKAWCTDLSVEITSLAVQVHGGMGFIEETGVAQLYRDARITPIYEGTNGIQAIDLTMRKLPMFGATYVELLADALAVADRLVATDLPDAGDLAGRVRASIVTLQRSTDHVLAEGTAVIDRLAAATPLLRVFGTVLGAIGLAEAVVRADDEQRAAGGSSTDAEIAGETATAQAVLRFYVVHVLPQVDGWDSSIRSGSRGLFEALPAELES